VVLSEAGTVTLLFTDLVGSTELLDRLGDEAAERLRGDHFRVLREAVGAHGGHEVKSLGDGLMVVFPGALAGVACAASMQQRIARYNDELAGVSLGLRVGLNAGEVISAENDYFGASVVVARRLCDRAQSAQTLVSEAVRALVGTRAGYRFSDLGALQLKGFSDPVAAFELDWRVEPSDGEAALVGEAAALSAAAAHAELPSALASEVRGKMVGRVVELEALSAELRRAEGGELRIALLGGEPGIGKTRLAAEFAHRAHEGGAAVLFGRSDPEPLLPFGPFVEALGSAVRQLPAERLRSLLGANVAVLARVLPQVAERCPEVAYAPAGDPESERYRLFDAIAALLRGLCEQSPVVLVIDDVHWADKPTLALLRQLVRTVSDARLLILGNYRQLDVGRGHPLAELIAERHRGVPLSLIAVEGLDREEVAALAAAWASQQAPAELVSLLWEETEGHPFFVQEVLRHLLEAGVIYERRGRLRTAGSLELLGVPTSVKEVIEQRLGRLDDSVLEVLRVAAVVGREFDAGLLGDLSASMSEDRLLRLLEDATAARLIAPEPSAFERYRFSHALIRETLHEGLSPARRVRLHRRTAEALERLDAEDRPRHLAELSRHYFEAAAASDAFGKAIDYAIAAGEQAVAQLAYEEASEHYERALRALELGSGDGRRSCDVLLALGDSRWAAGEYGAAREAFARAAALAERERLPTQLGVAALGFGGRIGFQAGVVDEQLIALLERGLELLDPADSPLRARVLARLCDALTLAAPLERRIALAEEALAVARRLGDDKVLAYVLLDTWWGTSTPDNLDERLAVGRELVEITRRLGNQAMLIEALIWLSVALVELGDIAEARELAASMEALLSHAGQTYLQWGVLCLCQIMLAMLDRPAAELEELVWRGLEIGQAAQNTTAIGLFGLQLVYLRYLQGRLPEMHATTVAFAEHFADIPAFRSAVAFVCAEIGLYEQARREFDQFATDFGAIPRDLFWLSGMDVLAIACGHLEDRDRAAALYDLVEPFGDRNIIIGAGGPAVGCAHRHLGILATVIGRFEVAQRHFEAALARNGAIGAQHARLLTCASYADMLLRRGAAGDRERALVLVDEALPMARAAGLDGVTDKLEAIRRGSSRAARAETHPPHRRRPVADTKAAITARGRDTVAKLVSGRSDEELQRRFGSAVAQRALFTAMAQGFQPRMAFGFQGAIEIVLRAAGSQANIRPPDRWTLTITGRKATVHHEAAVNPAVSIRTDAPTFMRLFTGERNPLTAYMAGQVELEGDVTLGPRLVEMFGGVKPFDVVEAA
jgi:class 3 adenylate cyclase/tetratricopeptide (TPR) repeat protein